MTEVEILMKKQIQNRTSKVTRMPKVFHRDFLGAHRYTTGGGTAHSSRTIAWSLVSAGVPAESCATQRQKGERWL